MRLVPDFGLVGTNPVALCLRLEVRDCLRGAREREGSAPQSADRFQSFGTALIQPENGWTKGLAVFVHIDDGAALRSERDRGDGVFVYTLRPQALAGFAGRAPEDLGILLGETRRSGIIRIDMYPLHGNKIPAWVKYQSANGLRAVIYSEKVFRHVKSPCTKRIEVFPLLWYQQSL